MGGFSLVELMLSLSLGLALSGVMVQGLVADVQSTGRFTSLLREKAWQRRTLALIEADLVQATSLTALPDHVEAACNLSGRRVLLQLQTPAGSITYSIGSPPSDIWRGHVLMRCGPGYSLEGSLTRGGTSQNRVVLDALPQRVIPAETCGGDGEEQPLVGVCLLSETPVFTLRLAQAFGERTAAIVQSEKAYAMPAALEQS